MTIHLSILLFFPLALATLGALRAARGRAVRAARRLARVARLRGADAVRLRHAGRTGCSTSPTTSGSRELGIRYMLGVDGLNLWLIALTALLFAASALWICLRPPGERVAALRVPHGARGDRGARRVHGAGPDPVRPVLRPDARPVLLPRRAVGRAGPGGGDVQARRLHARRLAAHARRGGRDRRSRANGGSELLDRRARRDADLDESDAALALRRVRARVPDQDAGVPVPRLDARRLSQHAAAGAGGVLRGALEGRRLRLPARRAAGLPGRDGRLPARDAADRRSPRSSTARRRRSRRPTRG